MAREIVKFDLDRDFSGFEALSKACFGPNSNLNKEMHRWLLDENPYQTDGNLLFLMKESDKPIACDGILLNELYLKGKIYSVAHSVKSMTDPNYRGQGLFRTMTENSVEQAKKAGADLILGLANKASYPAYQKFNWETLFEKEVLVKPIHIKKFLKRKLRFTPLAMAGDAVFSLWDKIRISKSNKDLNFTWLEQVPSETQQVWNRFKDKYDVLLVRDYKYLSYRYNARPDVSYRTLIMRDQGQIVGYAILREASTEHSVLASVAEFFTDPFNDNYIKYLAQQLTKYAYERGLDYLVLSCGDFGNYRQVLKTQGYHPTLQPPVNNMMIACALNDEIKLEDLKDAEHWHVTQGDGDAELDL
ncbi:MAG: GNAT family N-acetyltransferase [Eubacteriales bacterium]|nr:GNAT family N-acetyltransferase [Eubacteriales bacterium]